MELRRRETINTIKLVLPRARITRRSGSQKQAAGYCMKEETRVPGTRWYSRGHAKRQGNRSDLDTVADLLITGECRATDVMFEYSSTWIRYSKALEKMDDIVNNSQKRDWSMEVILYWGDSGVGKTRRMFAEAIAPYYVKDPSTKWFHNYRGERDVLIDDYVGSLSFDFFNRIIDRYELPVETKGNVINFCGRRIFLTSNLPLEEWYPGINPTQLRALKRRFTRIEHMTSENPYVPSGASSVTQSPVLAPNPLPNRTVGNGVMPSPLPSSQRLAISPISPEWLMTAAEERQLATALQRSHDDAVHPQTPLTEVIESVRQRQREGQQEREESLPPPPRFRPPPQHVSRRLFMNGSDDNNNQLHQNSSVDISTSVIVRGRINRSDQQRSVDEIDLTRPLSSGEVPINPSPAPPRARIEQDSSYHTLLAQVQELAAQRQQEYRRGVRVRRVPASSPSVQL